MLFKPEHIQMILNGTKTATRRDWKKQMVKVGGVYKVKTKMLSRDYACKIRVTKLYQQKLYNMSQLDYAKEGYTGLKAFKHIWEQINHDWKPSLVVWVVEFERAVE